MSNQQKSGNATTTKPKASDPEMESPAQFAHRLTIAAIVFTVAVGGYAIYSVAAYSKPEISKTFHCNKPSDPDCKLPVVHPATPKSEKRSSSYPSRAF